MTKDKQLWLDVAQFGKDNPELWFIAPGQHSHTMPRRIKDGTHYAFGPRSSFEAVLRGIGEVEPNRGTLWVRYVGEHNGRFKIPLDEELIDSTRKPG